MSSSLLVKFFGFPATLLFGDTLVLDRWLWLRRKLGRVANGSRRLLDVGCGTGAFTIGAALRGYEALGLSWDERNQRVAQERATLCKADLARFEVQDVRSLGERADLVGQFDVVICLETIEHVLNDASLMTSMARCLKPGGMLCLTTPNFDYRPITKGDEGPFLTEETGWHVRKGYTEQDLSELCRTANLEVCKVGFISGFLSQKVTWLFRTGNKLHLLVGWLSTLFLRIFPPVIDGALARWTGWPGFSITLVARKP